MLNDCCPLCGKFGRLVRLITGPNSRAEYYQCYECTHEWTRTLTYKKDDPALPPDSRHREDNHRN